MTDDTKETKKEEKSTKASPKLAKIIEEVEKLSVLELSDLVKALEEKFGVSAAAPVAMAAAAPAGAAPAAVEEKSEYNVILAAAGANKIGAIKAVRELKPEMGLKEAKDLVEAAPKELLKAVDKKTAEEAKKKLEAAGCQVELK
jgi:large subunit ribosomal protein L7/L12